eukprot:59530_1
MEQTKVTFTVKQLREFAFALKESTERTRVRKVMNYDKFQRMIQKELRKLQEIDDENKIYSSTSIFHLSAIWNYCIDLGLNNVKSLCKKMKYHDVLKDKECMVVVDVVCKKPGIHWIKIKNKNPYSIQAQMVKTESRHNIFNTADNYINAAKANRIKFKIPKIEFVFTKGITSDIHYLLTNKGIKCIGNVIKDNILWVEDDEDTETAETTNNDDQKTNDNEEDDEVDESGVNLGPKTMMTMITALANKEILDELWQVVENYVMQREDNPDSYKSTIYQQALNFTYNANVSHKIFSDKSTQMLSNMVGNYYEELQFPAVPIIMQYIGTKQLYCCQSAWRSVSRLVGMGAGPNEFARYKQLEAQIKVIPDQLSERALTLKGKKGMTAVNLAVFGTGDSLRMLTVAGVPTFVRKAKQKGVDFYCKLHDVRPFIEQYQVGYQIFKINQGFDVAELQKQIQDDDVDLDFDDDDDDDEDDDESDGDMVELEDDFETFDLN